MLYVLSVRQKVPKNSALGKNLCKRPLLAPPKASPRSGTCSPLQAFDCFQGAAELVLCGYIRKFIPAQNFKQSSHNGLKTVGLALDFSTVPFRRWRVITIAIRSAMSFHAHKGNSNKKPSPSKSQLKAVAVQGESEEMFEVR